VKQEEAYEWALKNVERNEDGGVDEKKIIDLVKSKIDFDSDAARARVAKTIVDRHKRPGVTDPDGQLSLPGLEPFAYEPNLLIADDDGHVVEKAKAFPNYLTARARRAQLNAQRVQRQATRHQQEASLYSDWAMKQLTELRRPVSEITFDTFVREAGFWSDDEAAPEEDPLDG
jgi:hypothetical protein